MAGAKRTIERRCIHVQGIVQGVGFRPFVYGQALHRQLAGFVLNDSQGVTIEVEGALDALEDFQDALQRDAPPLARIDSIAVQVIPTCGGGRFVIAHSQASHERLALISADTAACDACVRELFDPADRRYGYPFINCTHCGPRFTLIQDIPYDRENTTMRVFPMCSACRAEYGDPCNRRFHAQPNACPACGPHVALYDWNYDRSETLSAANRAWTDAETIQVAAQRLASGAILAIKGLGGYHLACDATNDEAVERLRQRKRRDARPFALMVADMDTARRLCAINSDEAALLASPQRPIVLLRHLRQDVLAPEVAPGCDTLGIMLPYTPLHSLLLRAFTQASSPERLAVLVMTSGNVSDEPMVYRDEDAEKRLSAIANGMLVHNRAIHMRCDDSVLHVAVGGIQFLRRSRGYAPEPISLSFAVPVPLLACGAHLKNTFCLGKGRQAFVSHHIGDLENLETLTSFREGIEHFQHLFDVHPEAIAYDLHPEYLATKYALDAGVSPKIGVQHHHAHIASVLAEHGLSGPVIGVAADGTGYGMDGAIWGCEVMIADLKGFERFAHLAYVPLPGGEQAIRQPWRTALAYLCRSYGDTFLNLDIPFVQQLDQAKCRLLTQMMAKGINCPPTSSLGRLFDAVAALIGLRGEVAYEGQAAIELEVQAARMGGAEAEVYPFGFQDLSPLRLDVSQMLRAIVRDIQRGIALPVMAARFHTTIAELLTTACCRAREQSGCGIVALSGGVFQNRFLLEQCTARLSKRGFEIYMNRRVPPNDGGISFGQLAVAAAQLS